MRSFEKVSKEEFKKYYDEELYENYELPTRKTKYSAGYDFSAVEDIVINPGEKVIVASGIKSTFESDEVLFIFMRSSLGIKKNIRLCNQVGVIESDYYNNIDNEGHLFIALKNEGNEKCVINKGTCFAQGVFTKFLTCGDEPENIRVGGIGSTEKKEK